MGPHIIMASSASFAFLIALGCLSPFSLALSVSRRDALVGAASLAGGYAVPSPAGAAETSDTSTPIDLAAIQAARKSSAAIPMSAPGKAVSSSSATYSKPTTPVPPPTDDPSPFLTLRGAGPRGQSTVKIPRIGYSLYKTPPDQAGRCVSLALRSGVRHLDLASSYGSNDEVSAALNRYLDYGLDDARGAGGRVLGIDWSAERPELLEYLDGTSEAARAHALEVVGTSGGVSFARIAPTPAGKAGRAGRRDGLFISHKVSNAEQSTDRAAVRRAVKSECARLGISYLDMVSLHSPLTDRDRRLATYEALLELRDAGWVKSVGVANFGLGPLREVQEAGLDLPVMNQLELSPFNQHRDVVDWCEGKGIYMGCGAWSKLSSADGPQNGWAVVADIAQKKGMTKAQVLVRWALQKGYTCVPRSASASKVERMAIAENSYGGVNAAGGKFLLTKEETAMLDGLDEQFKAGKLGRRDGWSDEDVTGPEWDPTDFL